MLNIDHTDPQRIGHTYWSVGDYKTINKIAAIERANGDINQVKFQCMDDTWSTIDNTKEPTTSWNDLLNIRAWQLRDRYSYLALLYSGGWDSHTVLMTYVNNNIPLDEIIIWDRTSYIEDPELDDAYQTAKKIIQDNNLKTKLTVFEIPWGHHANVYKEAGDNYLYLPGCPTQFNQTGRIIHHEALDSFLKIKNQHVPGTAGFIEAHDKPRVNLWEGRWYHFYIDSAMYQYVGKGASEMFYYTPDLPELQLKQAYMSIRYFEHLLDTIPGAGHDLIHQIQSFSHPELYADWNRYMGRVCSANYSAIHGLGKRIAEGSPKRLDTLKLLNYTKGYVDEVYSIYDRGLEKVKDITGIDLLKNSMPGITSKQYYMRDQIFHKKVL